MGDTIELTREQVAKKVEDYFNKTTEFTGVGSGFTPTQELLLALPGIKNQVLEIGTSILCTKWGVSYPGGGFVQAIVDNDLLESFGRADSTNKEFIGFYCKLIYNVGYGD